MGSGPLGGMTFPDQLGITRFGDSFSDPISLAEKSSLICVTEEPGSTFIMAIPSTLCLDPLGKPQPPSGAQEGHHSRGMAHPCLRLGCVLPLPPFTLVCSEMNFSSLVLRGISTPYLPWVPSSTRMKWEWLLSRHDRLPWFSSSSTYSAGKPPCKCRRRHSGRSLAEEQQMGKVTSTWGQE